MKLARKNAIMAFQGLTTLEKGINGKPFDFSWEAWEKIYMMVMQLQSVQETYTKARNQRFQVAANGKAQLDQSSPQATDFVKEEEEKLEEMITVKMPKKLLTEEELRLKDNRIPPTVLVQLKPIVEWRDRPDLLDDDEDAY